MQVVVAASGPYLRKPPPGPATFQLDQEEAGRRYSLEDPLVYGDGSGAAAAAPRPVNETRTMRLCAWLTHVWRTHGLPALTRVVGAWRVVRSGPSVWREMYCVWSERAADHYMTSSAVTQRLTRLYRTWGSAIVALLFVAALWLGLDASGALGTQSQRHVSHLGIVNDGEPGVQFDVASDRLVCEDVRASLHSTKLLGGGVGLSSRANSATALRSLRDAHLHALAPVLAHYRDEAVEHGSGGAAAAAASVESSSSSTTQPPCVCAPMFGVRVNMVSMVVVARPSATVDVWHMYNVEHASAEHVRALTRTDDIVSGRLVAASEDHSALFLNRTELVVRERYTNVEVRFMTDACDEHTVRLHDAHAFCIQQCIDIINGSL